jgi:hypothetical protein
MDQPDVFARALRNAHADALGQAPAEHSGRTPDCPPLTRIAVAVDRGWQPGELGHVAGCPVCRKLVLAAWREECPAAFELARHAAGGSPLSPLLQAHLEEDGCERCASLLRSAWLGAIAAALRAGAGAAQELESLAASVAVGFARFDFAPSFEPAESAQPRFQIFATDPAGRLRATLREQQRELVVYIEAQDVRLAGKTVLIEVLGCRAQLQASVFLQMVANAGAFGHHSFGLFADAARDLGAGSIGLVAALES